VPKPRSATSTSGNLLRSTTWAGLQPGDGLIVNLEGERRRSYVFVAHVINHVSGDEWVEVRGGRSGEAKDRSFRCDVIYPISARRGSRLVGLSLAEAPRLPLG